MPKRPRLRFTLRTLAIVITLVCCYAACWGPTMTNGVKDVHDRQTNTDRTAQEVTAHFPLIVSVSSVDSQYVGFTQVVEQLTGRPVPYQRCYYFWFFGFVAKLPYEQKT